MNNKYEEYKKELDAIHKIINDHINNTNIPHEEFEMVGKQKVISFLKTDIPRNHIPALIGETYISRDECKICGAISHSLDQTVFDKIHAEYIDQIIWLAQQYKKEVLNNTSEHISICKIGEYIGDKIILLDDRLAVEVLYSVGLILGEHVKK